MATDLALWVSIFATLVAASAAWVSYAVYRSQADPDVMVFAELDEDYPVIVNLVIKNFGKAPAFDLRFSSNVEIPTEASGMDFSDPLEEKIMKNGPLVHGIPFLPPNGKRVLQWGRYEFLEEALGENHLLVTARYKSHHFGMPWKIRHRQTSIVEILSFLGSDLSTKSHARRIAERLAEISKNVGKMAKGNRTA